MQVFLASALAVDAGPGDVHLEYRVSCIIILIHICFVFCGQRHVYNQSCRGRICLGIGYRIFTVILTI